MYRQPDVRSTFFEACSGTGSGRQIRRTPKADSRNETASIAIVTVAPTRLISPPPSGGPTLSVIQVVDSNRLLASDRRAGSTNALRCAPLADVKAIVAAAWTTPTTHNCT